MSCIPLTKEQLLSLKAGDKVISSRQLGGNPNVMSSKMYYEVVAVHEGNIVVAARRYRNNEIIKYTQFEPSVDHSNGELLDNWFMME
jgi:hypothetical protein